MAKILVVDDSEMVRRSLGGALVCAGHDVVGASTVWSAFTHLQERKFDLVITDIVMPDMDGLEAILTLRRMAQKPAILAISGGGCYLDTSWLKFALEFGADAALEKPFSLKTLISTVNSLVAEREPSSPPATSNPQHAAAPDTEDLPALAKV